MANTDPTKTLLLFILDLAERVARSEVAIAGLVSKGVITADKLNRIQVDIAEIYSPLRDQIEALPDAAPLADILEVVSTAGIIRTIHHYKDNPNPES